MKASDHLSTKQKDWTPSAEAQMVIFWRIMHLYMSRYGSIPIGQMLVELTTTVLNELGRPPTVTDHCDATGLPKSSISRYVSAQMSRDMVAEIIESHKLPGRIIALPVPVFRVSLAIAAGLGLTNVSMENLEGLLGNSIQPTEEDLVTFGLEDSEPAAVLAAQRPHE